MQASEIDEEGGAGDDEDLDEENLDGEEEEEEEFEGEEEVSFRRKLCFDCSPHTPLWRPSG